MERGDGHEKNAQKAHESEKQPGICTWLCAWTYYYCYWLCHGVLRCVYAIFCCKLNVDDYYYAKKAACCKKSTP